MKLHSPQNWIVNSFTIQVERMWNLKSRRFKSIALPGFEPGSTDPESVILDRCTTGLYTKFLYIQSS